MMMNRPQVVLKLQHNLPANVNKNNIKRKDMGYFDEGDTRQPLCFSTSLSNSILTMMFSIRQRVKNNNPNIK